jgi:hypothetical protein
LNERRSFQGIAMQPVSTKIFLFDDYSGGQIGFLTQYKFNRKTQLLVQRGYLSMCKTVVGLENYFRKIMSPYVVIAAHTR